MSSENNLNLSRKKFFEDSAFNPNNQKYGLFSFSGTLAVSKEPYFVPVPAHKDQDGNVITAPHNVLRRGPKSGKTNDAYFSTFEYAIDKYNDPVRPQRSEKERTEKLKKFHENVWKPARQIGEPASLFPHEASDRHLKINRKQADGTVRLEPKNILTSPAKIGEASVTPGVLFGPKIEHMTDEYERKVKTVREEAKKSRAKRHGGAFYNMSYGNKSFNADITIYGGNDAKPKEKKRSNTAYYAKHDRPFYPSNPGKKDMTIGNYPEHMPDPVKSVTRKSPSEAVPWKVTYKEKSKPAPSISGNFRNLRTEFPRLRRLSY